MKTDFEIPSKLKALEEAHLKRTLREVSSPQGRTITIDGKAVLNFCSNNYLGLADDMRLRRAAREAIEIYGLGTGASRLVCGNMSLHQELEERIARFKGKEKALTFSTGYMANVGIISSLFGKDDCIFFDRLNHASLIDGIILSRAGFKRYAHNDMKVLKQMLEEDKTSGQKAIITDSVFSMEGDIAPLDEIVSLAKHYNCMVMVDEAHAFGVLGKKGRGAVEHFGLEGEIDIEMGTFSKAAGSFGAYVCGKKELIDYFINKARSFIYTTGMPVAVAAASIAAIDIIEKEDERRDKLWKNTRYTIKTLKEKGFNLLNTQTPIIPIVIGDEAKTLKFSEKLFEKGLYVSAIRPPTVPAHTSRLRITLMATHTESDINHLITELDLIGKELCII